MEDPFSMGSLPGTPTSEVLPLTISPSATSLGPDEKPAEKKEEKKPAKKRKSWGQELPTPKTNLPPRKRAKTEDEKEQRRIERVLRNRAAAQTSRERKRLEMEKLENEKVVIEQQNQFLLQRLAQMEAENNRLSQQVARLSAEIHGSSSSQVSDSPTLTATLFKQDDDIPLERVPFPTPSDSPIIHPSSLAESSDMTQHPAAVLCDLQYDVAAPLSDDDFHRLFNSDSSTTPESSFPEDVFIFDILDGDLPAFSFDSLVDFNPEEPTQCPPDEASHETSGVQPSPGASTSRCDGQGLAASCQ
ncbi:transcription factor that binds to CRE motif [Monascus purpureus]|uniref:Transcription factor that binds to CRE motif n=1 Tax=Monascus purpureus TaxID=5098 RepID=A0A507R2J7_MONPU|nr:transcription factor that binds to CRE motif [Monascus purpureus]